jgi:hypothetical protein
LRKTENARGVLDAGFPQVRAFCIVTAVLSGARPSRNRWKIPETLQ